MPDDSISTVPDSWRDGKPRRIAVIGGGVAGLTSAWLLSRRHQVTLLERNRYVGGHTNTFVIPSGPDAGTPVDTGFIVKNNRTYPLFNELLKQLGVPDRNSDMSFGFHDEVTGLQYASTHPVNLFAQKRNLFSLRHWRLILEILRFNRIGGEELTAGKSADESLGDFLVRHRFNEALRDDYLVPMAAAIWSAKPDEILHFPAITFLRFFSNHGLLTAFDQPIWQTVVGGSHAYVKAFRAKFHGEVRTEAAVRGIRRTDARVTVTLESGEPLEFDGVVLASHADETLRMLADPSAEESRLLGPWRYQRNHCVLHTDITVMPSRRRAWASWNYARERGSAGDHPVSVTYDMNRLQGLTTHHRYLVTLNRRGPINPSDIVYEVDYTHPVYDKPSVNTQTELPTLQGRRNTWFAGSYFGYGFHEDAVRSAVLMAKGHGIELAAGWVDARHSKSLRKSSLYQDGFGEGSGARTTRPVNSIIINSLLSSIGARSVARSIDLSQFDSDSDTAVRDLFRTTFQESVARLSVAERDLIENTLYYHSRYGTLTWDEVQPQELDMADPVDFRRFLLAAREGIFGPKDFEVPESEFVAERDWRVFDALP
jgi:predicted NAD/FAD-binding protein